MIFRTTPHALVDPADVAARLRCIAARGRLEVDLYASAEERPRAERIQQRFWTPDEIASASESDEAGCK